MKWLFEHFLNDETTYRASQAYWEALFLESLPCTYDVSSLGLNYINNPDNDGNPVFCAIFHPLQLAVRVIQQPVGDADDRDLDYWIDTSCLRSGGLAVRELVISCCPSEENRPEVKRLLRDWFSRGKVVASPSPQH